jgi:hypothetical protein
VICSLRSVLNCGILLVKTVRVLSATEGIADGVKLALAFWRPERANGEKVSPQAHRAFCRAAGVCLCVTALSVG